MRFPLLAALLVPALAASAQGTYDSPRYHFGFGFSFTQPSGDLRSDTDSQPGFGFSMDMPMDFGRGQVLRPRFDVVVHSVKSATYGPVPPAGTYFSTSYGWDSATLSRVGLGMDYLHYLSGSASRGAYLLAGISVDSWNLDLGGDHHTAFLVTGPGGATVRTDAFQQASSSFGGSLGVGFQMSRRLGFEFRLHQSQYRLSDVVDAGNLALASQTRWRKAADAEFGMTFRW
jgi:hypothetical protein